MNFASASVLYLSICIFTNISEASISLRSCSLTCDENGVGANDITGHDLRSSIVGRPGKQGHSGERGPPGLPGEKGGVGDPGTACNCSQYDEIMIEMDLLRKTSKLYFANADWYQASNDLFYKLFLTKADYETAKNRCNEIGTRLASTGMRNITLKKEIYDTVVLNEGPWIGLDDLEQQHNWMWLDGVPSDRENTDWASGQPDNARGIERCGHFWWKVAFNDRPCSYKLTYLCEK